MTENQPEDASKQVPSKPRSSVLVSTVSYHTAELVSRLLRSMVPEHECATIAGIDLSMVIVDNASGDADAIERAIQELGIADWAKVIRAERNGGFAYGNNLVLRHAYDCGRVPDYFWLLNPDTEVRVGATQALVEFMNAHPKTGIAGSGLETEAGVHWPYAFRFPTFFSELDTALGIGLVSRLLKDFSIARWMGDSPGTVDWMPGASMMLRRELVEDIGGMDESYFLYYEETDYCRRVLEAGWSIWYVPSSRVMHAAGGSTGVTSARERPRRLPDYWYESRRRYFHKNFGLAYAATTDGVYLVATVLGKLKQLALGRFGQYVPFQAFDVLRHSVILPSNREVAPTVGFRPSPDMAKR